MMKIMVMGAGAIGSLFGGMLAKAGNDVTLIAREDHVNAIRKNGLKIEGVSGEHIINVKAYSKPTGKNPDLVLLTVKAYDTKEAVMQVKPHLNKRSVLLCLQNGLGIEEEVEKIVGRDKVLRGITYNGAMLVRPGTVIHTGKGKTLLGELDKGVTKRVRKIAQILNQSGLPTHATDNITEAVWEKVLINSGINPFGALTRLKNGELLRFPDIKDLMIETVNEGVEVARKFGFRVERSTSKMIEAAKATAKNKNSMLQDIENGKRTEIDYINGAIFRLGKRLGVQTPLNRILTFLIKGLETVSIGKNYKPKKFNIPLTHPRAESLHIREKLIHHYQGGAVAMAGLIAHGRGEAFDYLIGEKTIKPALEAIKTAGALLLLAKYPVISVNGNSVALVVKEMVELAQITEAKLEINLFYRTKERELAIKKVLESAGAREILGLGPKAKIPELMSERRYVDPHGILIADVVLVPLEDGDRTEALRKMGKKVIAIDLNPLSRTARYASVTIVDNIVRAMPKLVKEVKRLKSMSRKELKNIVENFNHEINLKRCLRFIDQRLLKLTKRNFNTIKEMQS